MSMSGFLGTRADPLKDLNLIMQVAILIVLLVGYIFKKDGKLMKHGVAMSTAVMLHTILIFLVMIPSLVLNSALLLEFSQFGVIITWIHVLAGIFAEISGLYLVGMWRFRSPPFMNCVKKKKLMKPLLILWVLALILGIMFYIYYYVI